MTSSWMAERVPLIPLASISVFAPSTFYRERLAKMTWKASKALASTFAVANPHQNSRLDIVSRNFLRVKFGILAGD